MRSALLWVVLFLFVARGAALDKPKLINGTAATVGKTLITVQDAYFYRALQRFKDGVSPSIVYEEGDELRRTVQKIVFEEMVYNEMKSFKFEGPPKSEAEKLINAQKVKGREGQWKEILTIFSKSNTSAIERIQKTLQVEQFLQKKVDTMTPVITDSESERYFKQNQVKFQGSSYEKLKSSIVLLLKKERLEKSLAEWVKSLKEKYGVTNYLGS